VQVAGLVWTRLGSSGAIDVLNAATGTTNLIVVANGYYTDASTAGDTLMTTAPTRVFAGSVTPGAGQPVPLVGVPNSASAVVLNLTALAPAARTAVTLHGTCHESSTPQLYVPGHTNRANTVVVKLCGAGRSLPVVVTGTATVLVDLLGWFEPGQGVGSFVAPPRQVARTAIAARHAVTLQLTGGSTTVPSSGVAVLLVTLTVRSPGSGYLVAYPTGSRRPATSHVDQQRAGGAANTVVVPAGTGSVTIYNNSSTAAQTVVDVVGWSS
jgi:hypothetical protein